MWPYSLTSRQFHVLLNSLFKVLFNFPSRYLFAIGLVHVFSLRWSLPPTLAVLPNNPTLDIPEVRQLTSNERPHTRYGARALSRELCRSVRRTKGMPNTASSIDCEADDLGAGLIPLHSQLLWESLLVSFPPLTDMLKFSGYSRLI